MRVLVGRPAEVRAEQLVGGIEEVELEGQESIAPMTGGAGVSVA